MSHINRRQFIQGVAVVAGTVALGPLKITPWRQFPPAQAPLANFSGYEALDKALADNTNILREIREASVMRRIASIEGLRRRSLL
jgi:hypothetical protein